MTEATLAAIKLRVMWFALGILFWNSVLMALHQARADGWLK